MTYKVRKYSKTLEVDRDWPLRRVKGSSGTWEMFFWHMGNGQREAFTDGEIDLRYL